MRIHIRQCILISLFISILLSLSCAGGPPTPGREIAFPKQGVTIKFADGWIGEVVSADWSVWERIQKGRTDETWVFPPVTARNEGAGPQGGEGELRYMNWRFKGVTGTFDPNVNPLSSQYPVPPGLWILDPLKLDLIEERDQPLPWPGLAGVTANTRIYENTHGTGATSAIWHTYTVIFNRGGNAYEFVMSIPDTSDFRDWIDKFWTSIEDITIEIS
ncbi:MAG: hypothetical protein NTY09_02595 [bacterium]|nr:hypothetical protein [bacterium]